MQSALFSRGIEQFNQQQFYECHDTLEAIWIEALELDKRFYQGILQVAVACHHLHELNLRGAVILLGEGVRRLSDYQPDYQDIDVTQLLIESDLLLQTLQRLPPENLADFAQKLFSPENATATNKVNCQLPKILRVDSST
ncbi:hypothetical protein Xen7305DRAFT_00015850 [Xenococcus sp. PCC 7305]|uniref:DUF309 domain-containing protein n=1 Tax=Xenococcus sp. PCC 7305 TaxID=102125 RepID=UPI0002ACF6DE|nr:DUF309 domain-containing protein [Xenococcus sp. PCC 7305]ELS01878.1 hypothetical protein Xen7305DRAFT_00015850 [Xenococcus sp. PCC 7305]